MCFNQTGDISTLDGTSLKEVDKFTYLGSSVSSTEKDVDTQLTKAWTAIDKLSIIWKSDMTDKMKRSFFQAVVVSILLYGCTTWTLIKWLEKKLDGIYTRMLRAILNKSWALIILFNSFVLHLHTIEWFQVMLHITNNWICLWRCSRCNGYRHRKWTRRCEFKSWTRLIAFPIAPLGNVWI